MEFKLHVKKQLQNFTKSTGDTLKLRCDFGGVPNNAKLKITWLKNEASLDDYDDERIMIRNAGLHSTRLRIADLAFLDSGFYTCRAESVDGQYGTAESTSMVKIRASV
ncbi:tyrosine-protein kinase transmembrane receptor ROR1-like, partial [Tropilaelaps mercedesae]